MWTVCWVENGADKWDRFETRDQVEELLEKLDYDPDAWIFPPAADDLALTGDWFAKKWM